MRPLQERQVHRATHFFPLEFYGTQKGDKEFIGVIEVRNMMFCPDGNWQKYITMAPVIDGKETLLHIAENIRRFDSKILLVRNSAGNIAGILTTNNLFMHLFPKQSN